MPRADVLLVSLGGTAGLRGADAALAASLRRAGAEVVEAEAARPREWRTYALIELAWARAARAAALKAIAEHRPRAILYSSVTAALLGPRPGAIRFDAPAAGNRPGRHGIWQRPVERRRLRDAPLLVPWSEGGLAEAPRPHADAVVVPVPVEPSGTPGERDIAAVTYGANPQKKGLDRVLAAWAAARHPGEELVVAGLDEAGWRRTRLGGGSGGGDSSGSGSSERWSSGGDSSGADSSGADSSEKDSPGAGSSGGASSEGGSSEGGSSEGGSSEGGSSEGGSSEGGSSEGGSSEGGSSEGGSSEGGSSGGGCSGGGSSGGGCSGGGSSGLPEGVRFAGMLPRDEYRALVRRARVFVCAPRREDYGIAQLEALADGCLLVTTPSSGPYVALPLARELDPRLVGGISEGLRTALDDPAADYAARAAAALAPFRPDAVDAVVREQLLPRLVSPA